MAKTIGRISEKKIHTTQVSLAEIKKFKNMLTKEGGFRYYKNRYNGYASPRLVSKKKITFTCFTASACFIPTFFQPGLLYNDKV